MNWLLLLLIIWNRWKTYTSYYLISVFSPQKGKRVLDRVCIFMYNFCLWVTTVLIHWTIYNRWTLRCSLVCHVNPFSQIALMFWKYHNIIGDSTFLIIAWYFQNISILKICINVMKYCGFLTKNRKLLFQEVLKSGLSFIINVLRGLNLSLMVRLAPFLVMVIWWVFSIYYYYELFTTRDVHAWCK